MKNISKYEDFINESGIYAHPTGEVTDWVQLHKPDTAYKFCVVKKTMRKHGKIMPHILLLESKDLMELRITRSLLNHQFIRVV